MGSDRKKIIWTIVIACAIIVVPLIFRRLFFSPAIDEEIVRLAEELTRNCPIMIDSETRLDNAIAMPSNTLQYNYTLVNAESDSVDVIEMRSYIKPIILNKVRTSPEMKIFRDLRVTMAFIYRDRDGEFMMKIAFSPDEYYN